MIKKPSFLKKRIVQKRLTQWVVPIVIDKRKEGIKMEFQGPKQALKEN